MSEGATGRVEGGAPGGVGGVRFRGHGATDKGLVRDENQDSFAVVAAEGEADPGGLLAVIADGMGGLAGGGTASRIVVDAVAEAFRRVGIGLRDALEAGVREANFRVHSESTAGQAGEQMGSTVTAFAVREGSAWVAHVGDSRAYRIPPEGSISRLTRDHTWVEELSRRGAIEPGSLQYSLHRSVLTRGVGLRLQIEVDLVEVPNILPGEVFVLCSDGLHEVVRDAEIEGRVRSHGADLEAFAADLIALARERGGPDNITVVAVRAEGQPPSEGPPPRRLFPASGFMPISLVLAFGLGVGAVLILERAPREEETAAPDILESLLEGPAGAELSSTPEGRKVLESIEEFKKTRDAAKKGR